MAKRERKQASDFEQKILDVARVARVVEGGRRFSFRVTVAIGNRNGKVGVGIAKAANVSSAVEKAVADAKKNAIEFPIVSRTIPHEISSKFGAAKLLLIPAVEGRGIIAGGTVRTILELVGIKDVSSKTTGSSNKINNARAAVIALEKLKGSISKVKVEKNKEVKENEAEKQEEEI
ncbi:MAG: 30S ribosomal protein S5 [bacterium]